MITAKKYLQIYIIHVRLMSLILESKKGTAILNITLRIFLSTHAHKTFHPDTCFHMDDLVYIYERHQLFPNLA